MPASKKASKKKPEKARGKEALRSGAGGNKK